MSLKTASVKQVKGALPYKESFKEETPIEGYLSKAVSDVCGWALKIILIFYNWPQGLTQVKNTLAKF